MTDNLPMLPIVIDVIRPRETLAVCPECGTRRSLPEDWQDIMRPTQRPDWDGKLYCRRGHQPGPAMLMFPMRNTPIGPDGSIVVHLVDDNDPARAACTGQVWGGVPDQIPRGAVMRLCPACMRIVRATVDGGGGERAVTAGAG